MPGDQADRDPRLQRLEEHAGFLERTLEQVSGEIAELSRRVQEVGRRLARIEERLAGPSDEDDDPQG